MYTSAMIMVCLLIAIVGTFEKYRSLTKNTLVRNYQRCSIVLKLHNWGISSIVRAGDMYFTIILTDTSGQEIAQRAISGDSGTYQMEVCAMGMLEKHGRSIVDTIVSVVRWDGKCYEIVEKNLLKGVVQEECLG
jgi:hypothetical protein